MYLYLNQSPAFLPGACAGSTVLMKWQLMKDSVNKELIRKDKCVTEVLDIQ